VTSPVSRAYLIVEIVGHPEMVEPEIRRFLKQWQSQSARSMEIPEATRHSCLEVHIELSNGDLSGDVVRLRAARKHTTCEMCESDEPLGSVR
jgi:hypothetical protein